MNPRHAAGIASHVFEDVGILFQLRSINRAGGIPWHPDLRVAIGLQWRLRTRPGSSLILPIALAVGPISIVLPIGSLDLIRCRRFLPGPLWFGSLILVLV